ncbi:TPA: hypothetical protein N3414_000666 [Klebsiella quasipneumoniae subsp. quasipneumoniae]|uniref:hypothetical protein n=1 Tax=Klebsiella quasipneumoniae TaxID=1463165 RepID=UPI00388E8906|nr:hypothetical protein [Klebsiella quasipneumoniae subsp. quasipneumoniae]HCM7673503.1 hypothetical protein [Klebsiella quasipneumoniae subsp. quasipneumoniae]
MKTINTNEDCPSEFFIFINLQNPIVYNNAEKIGVITSSGITAASMEENMLRSYISGNADYLPFIPNPNASPAISMYQLGVMNTYRVEYNAEISRKEKFKVYPSRLSSMYAFADYETCEQVSRKYNWDINTVRKFELQDHPLTRIAKVNMEIISLVRHAYGISGFMSDDEVWQHYWSGQGNLELQLPGRDFQPQHYESGVIWEYLIEGSLRKVD